MYLNFKYVFYCNKVFLINRSIQLGWRRRGKPTSSCSDIINLHLIVYIVKGHRTAFRWVTFTNQNRAI